MARSVSQVGIKVTVDDKDLQSLSEKFNKLEKEMRESKTELKKVNAELKKMGGSLKKTQKDVEGFIGNIRSLGKGIHGVGIKFLFFKHLLTQVFDGLNFVYEKIREGAAFADLQDHLGRTVEGFDKLSERAQFASAGMLSKEQVARSSALMKQFGMDISRMDEVSGVMAKTAIATGQNVDHMLDSFTRGVARLSPLILDNLGITISLKDAYQDYAAELGVTTDALTKADQIQAVFNESLRVLKKNTEEVDLSASLTAQLEEYATALRDASIEMKAGVARGLFGGGDVGKEDTEAAFEAVLELAGTKGANLVDIMSRTNVSLEEIITTAIMGKSPVDALNSAFSDLPENFRDSREAAEDLASKLLSSANVSKSLRDSNEFLASSQGALKKSLTGTISVAQRWENTVNLLARSQPVLEEGSLKKAAAVDRDTAATVENLMIIRPLKRAYEELLGTFLGLNPAIGEQAAEMANLSEQYAFAELDAQIGIEERRKEIKGITEEIQKIQGLTDREIKLAAARKEHSAALKELSTFIKAGLGDKQSELVLTNALLDAVKKVKELEKPKGAKLAKVTTEDLVRLELERFKTKVQMNEEEKTAQAFRIAQKEFEIELARINDMKARSDKKQLLTQIAQERHAQSRLKIERMLAEEARKAAEAAEKSLAAAEEFTDIAVDFARSFRDIGGVFKGTNIMTATMGDIEDLKGSFEDFLAFKDDVLQDKDLMKDLEEQFGLDEAGVLNALGAVEDGFIGAIRNAEAFGDVLKGIDDVASGLVLALSRVGDGLDLIEQDFTSAQDAYNRAVEAGAGAEELASLAQDVDAADWEQFRLAMALAQDSLSAIQSSPDMMGKVQGAIQAIGSVGAAFIDDTKERAAIMAAMEFALGIASFAAQDYYGGVAHLAAAGLFTAIAAGAISKPGGSAAQHTRGQGSTRGGGGGSTETTINVHMSGLTTLTEAEVGAQIYQALGQAKQQGYVP